MSITRRSALGLLAAVAAAPALGQLGSGAKRPLKIGVIGAGWLGGTVGGTWVKAGHEVLFSSRNPDRLQSMARDLGPRASVGLPAQAAAFGDVLLFAVPYDALPALGRDLQAALRGKVILDACNPSSSATDELAKESAENGVGAVSRRLLPGPRLVRAFSAVDATAVERSSAGGRPKLGVPIGSDDRQAVEIAAQLVIDSGCDPVVVRDLQATRSFQRGNPGFRANTDAARLQQLIASAL